MVKLFIAEPGSDNMQKFYENEADRHKIVAALTPVEARSAIYRFRRRKLLTAKQTSAALDRLAIEVGSIFQQPINSTVLDVSCLLIDRHQIRSLDAIQLAAAIVIRNTLPIPDVRFIASDKELLEAAVAEGFAVWNPAD